MTSTKPPSIWQWVERTKWILEIAAILVAGAWAYARFMHDVAPSLVERANLTAKLGWEKVSEKQCQAEYEVHFQNIGTVPISLAASQISVWYLSEPNQANENLAVEYLDPMVLRQKPALYTNPNDRLPGTYAPGTEDDEGFSFIVRNVKGRRVLFEIEIWNQEDANRSTRPEATWHDFHWDTVCGDQGQNTTPN